MKIVLAAALVLSSVTSLAADGPVPVRPRTVVCSQSPAVPDDNYTVSILGENGRFYLQVVHSTFAGAVTAKEVARVLPSKRIGGPTVYQTANYTLNVNSTNTPNPKGRLGTFTDTKARAKVSVYCK